MTSPSALLRSLADAVLTDALFPWALEHVREGDPVPRAWLACRHDGVMLRLLARIGSPLHVTAARVLLRATVLHRCCGLLPCQRCSDAVRSVVPTLAFADVLELLEER